MVDHRNLDGSNGQNLEEKPVNAILSANKEKNSVELFTRYLNYTVYYIPPSLPSPLTLKSLAGLSNISDQNQPNP